MLVSPGDKFLYVADNNNNNVGAPRKLWRFRLKGDGSVDRGSKTLIFDWKDGRGPDGIKMDTKGRIFAAGGRNKATQFESADRFKGGVHSFAAAKARRLRACPGGRGHELHIRRRGFENAFHHGGWNAVEYRAQHTGVDAVSWRK